MVLLRIYIVCCLLLSLSIVWSSLASTSSAAEPFSISELLSCGFIDGGAFTEFTSPRGLSFGCI